MLSIDHRLLLAAVLPLCLLAAGTVADEATPIGVYAVPAESPAESDVIVAYAPGSSLQAPASATVPPAPAPAAREFSTKNDLETWPAVRSRATLGYEEPDLSRTDLPADRPPAFADSDEQHAAADPYPLRERGLALSESQQVRGKFKARNGSAVISVGIGF